METSLRVCLLDLTLQTTVQCNVMHADVVTGVGKVKIDRVEVFAVAPRVQRFTWSHDLPEQHMTNTLVRISTDDGVEGVGGVSNYTSYDFDRYTAETMRHMIPALVGRDPLQREQIWNSLRSRVFPIEPGATRRVILRYTQVLGRDGDLLRVKYPRIIATTPGSEGLEQGSLQRPERRHPFTLQIRVADAESYATPYPPTHTIDVRERHGELDISYEGSGASHDFELFLPMVEALVGASVVTHAPAGEDGYFMLLISPGLSEKSLH